MTRHSNSHGALPARRSLIPSAIAVAAACVAATACSAPEREPGFDRMEFANQPELDDGVVESAVEVIQGRVRPRPAGSPKAQKEALVVLPAPRCANQSDREGPSLSVGGVTSGALESPCRITSAGPGYISTNKNGYGTDETVALLQWAAGQMAAQFPGSPPLVIGAISKAEGGFYPPHKSHQSGRDVDIGFPRTDHGAKQFQPTDASTLDTERLWSLLDAWLASGRLGFVFMDYDLQAALYQDLLDHGFSERQLAPIFQYPAPKSAPQGLIRHAAGHADHLHVRFRCPETDKPGCVD